MDQTARQGRVTLPAAGSEWDVVVIGAGPAGAVAARESAQHGLRTLLVDAKSFPREKICGGCLNQRALQILNHLQLDGILSKCGGSPIDSLRIHAAHRSLNLSLPQGSSISRGIFDRELVLAAIQSGVEFLPETTAVVRPEFSGSHRRLQLSTSVDSVHISSRIVVAADGVRRSSLKELPEFASQVATRSRIGAGITLHDSTTEFPAGRITMAVAREGYVGIARSANDTLHLAAAFDPEAVKKSQSLSALASQVLNASGTPVPGTIHDRPWHGTPLLTSCPRQVAAEGIFLIGDSAGYIEPFTGEGIAAALESALLVAPLVKAGVADWRPTLATEWIRRHRSLIGRRQWICRSLASLLRSPVCVSGLIHASHLFPAIPQFFVNRINHTGRFAGQLIVEHS